MEKYNSTDTSRESIKSLIFEGDVKKEISLDFTLPDYMPEIKRLLKTECEMLLPETSFGMNDCEVYGNMDIYVYYIGSDNQIYCAPLGGEYRVNIPLDTKDGLFCDGNVNVTCDSVNGRVTAKRKISVRAKINVRAAVFCNIPIENEFMQGADPSYTEKLTSTLSACKVLSKKHNFKVNDEIVSDLRDGEVRVISAKGNIGVDECNIQNDSISCKGNVYLKLILCREGDESVYTVNRKIPFSENIGVQDVASAMAYGIVNEVNVSVEDGRIELECVCDIKLDCAKNIDVAYTKDMYSTICYTECDYAAYKVLSFVSAVNSNVTLSDTRELDELKIGHESRLVDVTSKAYVDKTEINGKNCKVTGRIKHDLIFAKDGEYFYAEMESSLNYNCEMRDDFSKVILNATAVTSRGRVDGERVGVDTEVYISASSYSNDDVNTLTSLHFGELIKGNESNILVAFPQNGETLWSLCKRYHVSCESIMKDIDKESIVKERAVIINA